MNLTIITGNKGGLGKSFIATMLVDYLVRHDEDFFALDSEMSSIQATFAKNIVNHIPMGKFKNLHMNTQQAADELVNSLSEHKNSSGSYIMDTGASTMDTLLENVDFFTQVQHALSININLTFLVGPYADSVVAAKQLLQGLQTLENPLKVNFLLFSSTQTAQHEFLFVHNQTINDAKKQLGFNTFYLPSIRQDYFDLVMKNHTMPCTYLANKDLSFGTRLRMESWLKGTFDPIAKELLKG